MAAHDHDLDDFEASTPDDDLATDQGDAEDDPWEGGQADEAADTDRRRPWLVILATLIAAALVLALVVALGF